MNVWELITANSSAGPVATAWQHLNSQVGTSVVIIGGAHEATVNQMLEATINSVALSSSVDDYLTASIVLPQLSAELDQASEASLCQ